ncbi:hypothetical protein CM15mP35_09610 [bacterium]|nr:MAG: hypothetical protein CM15mP35_09610 [bacterium]
MIEDSFDEFQLNSHNLHLEIAKFFTWLDCYKSRYCYNTIKTFIKRCKNWGVKADKLKVIYNGTRITNNEFSKSNSNIIKLITVGRLAPWKNVNTIIEACHLLKNQDLKLI